MDIGSTLWPLILLKKSETLIDWCNAKGPIRENRIGYHRKSNQNWNPPTQWKVKCAFRLITGIDYWQKLRKIDFGSLINPELKGWKTLYCSARTHFKWGKMRRLDERQSHCFEKLSWKNWLVFWHDAHDVPTIVWEVVRLHICIFQEKSLYPNPSLGWVGWGLKFSLEMTYLGMIYHIQKDSCGLNAHNAPKKCLTFEIFFVKEAFDPVRKGPPLWNFGISDARGPEGPARWER